MIHLAGDLAGRLVLSASQNWSNPDFIKGYAQKCKRRWTKRGQVSASSGWTQDDLVAKYNYSGVT